MKYLSKSDPKAWFNNIWIFSITMIIYLLTLVSLEMKMQSKPVYVITKTIESMLKSQGIDDSPDLDVLAHGMVFK
jgi:hypothetical protein